MTNAITQSNRNQSLDIIRGAVMILMAIDHVRVFSGVPAGGPEAGIFFTRWVTHFCAPAFVFFAGTSAFLYGRKEGNLKALSQYLLTRGFLLVILELTLIRFSWSFNFNYSEFILAGVIWMIGWCMVLLSFMVRLRPATIGLSGVAIVFGQQLFAYVPMIFPETMRPSFGRFWEFIYSSGLQPWQPFSVLYVLVPWIGVMMAGYGFGLIMTRPAESRDPLCFRIGMGAIISYILIGTILISMNPVPENAPPFLFRLLNQQKYPASQLFLMMTLGPAIALIPILEKVRGWFADILAVFGRVPFFYYLLHIPIIHVSALIVYFLRDGAVHHEWFTYAPYAQVPQELRWNLPMLYMTFFIDIAILYASCRSYVRYKFSHTANPILKYV
jgi:uncharacterized membrane protein